MRGCVETPLGRAQWTGKNDAEDSVSATVSATLTVSVTVTVTVTVTAAGLISTS